MKTPFVELVFYETYYFANIVKTLLEDQFAYLRTLHEFYGDGQHLNYIRPFPRFSAFHAAHSTHRAGPASDRATRMQAAACMRRFISRA